MCDILNIVTVVYNSLNDIDLTIRSVINHKLKYKIKYFVIDGGSTDGTIDKIKYYSKYIDVLISEPDFGIYDAMNKSLELIDNDGLILWLNSGDILGDINFLNKKDLKNFDVLLASTKRIKCGMRKSVVFKSTYLGINSKYYLNNKIHHQAFFIRKFFLNGMVYNYNSFGMVADLQLMLISCEEASKAQRLLIIDDIVTFYKSDGVSDIPNINRLISQFKIISSFDLNIFYVFISNPYKFIRMVCKSLIPHSLGKLLT